jgi:hypothetical protein
MGIVFGFIPFIAFALGNRLFGSIEGLLAGTCAALIVLGRDVLVLRHAAKLLEVGTLLLLGALAAYAIAGHPDWSAVGVRLRVDVGLLLLIGLSLLLRRPFTLQYAREHTSPDVWNTDRFVRTNYVITGVWAIAFAIIALADAMHVYVPTMPSAVGIAATAVAIRGAFKFTSWYPERLSEASVPKSQAHALGSADGHGRPA